MEILGFATLLAASVASILIINALSLWNITSSRLLVAFSVFLGLATICFLFFDGVPQHSARLMLGLGYFFIISASTSLFLFTLVFTRHGRWIRFQNLTVLGLGPMMTFCVVGLGSPHWLSMSGIQPIGTALILNGVGMRLIMLFNDVILYISTLFLVSTHYGDSVFRRKLGLLVIGLLAPMLASLTGLIGWDLSWHLPFLLMAYSLTGIIFFFVLFGQGLLKIVSIPREVIIEKMHLPWMVVDTDDKIRDINLAAESAIGKRANIIGKPVENVLGNWSNIVSGTNDARELHLKGESLSNNQRQYYDLTALPILDKFGQGLGRLLLWRDITEQKRQELATQQARDEIFGLLYSISGAASRAQSLNEFLTASLFQVVNVFEFDCGAIFLAGENDEDGDRRTFLLAAHQGLSPEAEKAMAMISANGLLATMVDNNPMLIKNIVTDARVPGPMRALGNNSMLIIPMATDDGLIGFFTLMRADIHRNLQADLARLDIVVKQVANFVNGERRRILAISLAERQKLVRDLHDSVTQKLYGLIALTEAAEAGKEAGSLDMLFKVLPKISENARQALKEMRLFLYQLQPVDLEHEGLQYVLHQRLAAVEGRANINARFIADDDVDLTLDKEVALYYIAEEALNNVLKHAQAKSVTVRLRQGRHSVIMEIEDDGGGFDLKQVREGGMGLKNMQHRAASIQGKLKISSTVDKGTKITVAVERDKIRSLLKR